MQKSGISSFKYQDVNVSKTASTSSTAAASTELPIRKFFKNSLSFQNPIITNLESIIQKDVVAQQQETHNKNSYHHQQLIQQKLEPIERSSLKIGGLVTASSSEEVKKQDNDQEQQEGHYYYCKLREQPSKNLITRKNRQEKINDTSCKNSTQLEKINDQLQQQQPVTSKKAANNKQCEQKNIDSTNNNTKHKVLKFFEAKPSIGTVLANAMKRLIAGAAIQPIQTQQEEQHQQQPQQVKQQIIKVNNKISLEDSIIENKYNNSSRIHNNNNTNTTQNNPLNNNCNKTITASVDSPIKIQQNNHKYDDAAEILSDSSTAQTIRTIPATATVEIDSAKNTITINVHKSEHQQNQQNDIERLSNENVVGSAIESNSLASEVKRSQSQLDGRNCSVATAKHCRSQEIENYEELHNNLDDNVSLLKKSSTSNKIGKVTVNDETQPITVIQHIDDCSNLTESNENVEDSWMKTKQQELLPLTGIAEADAKHLATVGGSAALAASMNINSHNYILRSRNRQQQQQQQQQQQIFERQQQQSQQQQQQNSTIITQQNIDESSINQQRHPKESHANSCDFASSDGAVVDCTPFQCAADLNSDRNYDCHHLNRLNQQNCNQHERLQSSDLMKSTIAGPQISQNTLYLYCICNLKCCCECEMVAADVACKACSLLSASSAAAASSLKSITSLDNDWSTKAPITNLDYIDGNVNFCNFDIAGATGSAALLPSCSPTKSATKTAENEVQTFYGIHQKHFMEKSIIDWRNEDVLDWLFSLNLHQYVDTFKINHIMGCDLLQNFDEEKLMILGINNDRHQDVILKNLKALSLSQQENSKENNQNSHDVSLNTLDENAIKNHHSFEILESSSSREETSSSCLGSIQNTFSSSSTTTTTKTTNYSDTSETSISSLKRCDKCKNFVQSILPLNNQGQQCDKTENFYKNNLRQIDECSAPQAAAVAANIVTTTETLKFPNDYCSRNTLCSTFNPAELPAPICLVVAVKILEMQASKQSELDLYSLYAQQPVTIEAVASAKSNATSTHSHTRSQLKITDDSSGDCRLLEDLRNLAEKDTKNISPFLSLPIEKIVEFIKRYLQELRDTVIPMQWYDNFIMVSKNFTYDNANACLRSFVKNLPENHRSTLQFLIDHMRRISWMQCARGRREPPIVLIQSLCHILMRPPWNKIGEIIDNTEYHVRIIELLFTNGEFHEPLPAFEAMKSIVNNATNISSQFSGTINHHKLNDKATKPSNEKSNLNELEDFAWYWGQVSRDIVHERIKGLPDGSFLVRDASSKCAGEYTLTLIKDGSEKLIKIFNENGKYGFVQPFQFKSVCDLIQYYRMHSLYQYNPNLDIKLQYPIRRSVQQSSNKSYDDVILLEELTNCVVDVAASSNEAIMETMIESLLKKLQQISKLIDENQQILKQKRRQLLANGNEIASKSSANDAFIEAVRMFEGQVQFQENLKRFAHSTDVRKTIDSNAELLEQKLNGYRSASQQLNTYLKDKQLLYNTLELDIAGLEGELINLITDKDKYRNHLILNHGFKEEEIIHLLANGVESWRTITKQNQYKKLSSLPGWNVQQYSEEQQQQQIQQQSQKPSLPHLDEKLWYLGSCSRLQAENLLTDMPNGTFLIRPRTNGQFALSIVCNQTISHCIIQQTEYGYGFAEPFNTYPNLKALVLGYANQSLQLHNESLQTELLYPIFYVRKPTSDKT